MCSHALPVISADCACFGSVLRLKPHTLVQDELDIQLDEPVLGPPPSIAQRSQPNIATRQTSTGAPTAVGPRPSQAPPGQAPGIAARPGVAPPRPPPGAPPPSVVAPPPMPSQWPRPQFVHTATGQCLVCRSSQSQTAQCIWPALSE